jgi:ABC-type transport system substrate-binding protein
MISLADETARANALKSGQVDVAPMGVRLVPKLPAEIMTITSPGLNFYNIYLNSARPPLYNPQVRQALNWAIDRKGNRDRVRCGAM